jgi:MGT family glycosyltransferase
MARVLYFNAPATGHLGPSLPVAAELVRRGHDVNLYCTADFRGQVEASGSQFAAYPPGMTGADLTAAATDYPPLELILMEYSEQLTPFCIGEIERLQPDLVMYDALAVWAWLATRVTGTPTVVTGATFAPGGKQDIRARDALRFARSLRSTSSARKQVRRRLQAQYPEVRFPAPLCPAVGDRNIRFTAPEFQLAGAPEDASYALVGPSIIEPQPDPGRTADWRPAGSAGPLVYVSLGTIYSTNVAFYRELFAAFDDYKARFVLSAGQRTDLDALGPVPENFVVRPFVPQPQVLAEADVFITHGGMNSIQESLYFGVPAISVPQTLEQAINSRQLARLGAGLVLGDRPPYGQVSAADLRVALGEVLGDPSFELAAKRLGASAKQAGGFAVAADEVERVLVSVSV